MLDQPVVIAEFLLRQDVLVPGISTDVIPRLSILGRSAPEWGLKVSGTGVAQESPGRSGGAGGA